MEGLAALKPAFRPDGQITAGNSSPLNAGATAMMLMSKEKAKEYKLKPLATIVSMGWAGVEPSVMGKGPVPASKMALKHAGLDVKDIDFWEINEAFCIVALYAIKKLGIDPNKVNVKGGGYRYRPSARCLWNQACRHIGQNTEYGRRHLRPG